MGVSTESNLKRKLDRIAKYGDVKLYDGPTPCIKCHTTERYMSTGTCVVCTKAQKAAYKKKAKEQQKYIHVAPCEKCGFLERYVLSDDCCHCKPIDCKPVIKKITIQQERLQRSGTTMTYQSDIPCRKCWRYARYVRTGACVDCTKAGARRRDKRIAKGPSKDKVLRAQIMQKHPNQKIFTRERECKKCGEYEFYVKSNSCKNCAVIANKKNRYQIKNEAGKMICRICKSTLRQEDTL